MSDDELKVRGLRVEAAWWGETSALAPIVLLHEGLGSVSRWRDVPEELARRTRRRVMAYSRFGHGQSDPPPRLHSIRFMHEEARVLVELLDAAHIDRAILLGHSDGGSVALIAAADDSARVHALVLEAPHVFVEEESLSGITRAVARYRDEDLRTRLARHHVDADFVFHSWSGVWLDPAFRAWNLEEFLPRVTCPVLLIQGKQDEYGTLRQIDAIARQVSGPVERLVLDDCGHSPHRDQRVAVLSAIVRFVDAIST